MITRERLAYFQKYGRSSNDVDVRTVIAELVDEVAQARGALDKALGVSTAPPAPQQHKEIGDVMTE